MAASRETLDAQPEPPAPPMCTSPPPWPLLLQVLPLPAPLPALPHLLPPPPRLPLLPSGPLYMSGQAPGPSLPLLLVLFLITVSW